MKKFIEKVFGTYSSRELKRIIPIVDKVDALEEEYKSLSDAQLKSKTDEFKSRLSNGESLGSILPEAFATVREACDRVLGMRPFRVQVIGGIILHQGRIAEMKTGEGKTLVATLPAYLNALTGEGVHIVTVNDYLAKRDSEWMGKVHRFLGLSVGLILSGMDSDKRRASYSCDITYGTNNELGFDYLRDNMVIYKEQMVQRGHVYAIVDEVDSILIDEARTPLIISGQGDASTQLYTLANQFAKSLKPLRRKEFDSKENYEDIDADYLIDEKARTVTLTKKGIEKAEKAFNLENFSDIENTTIVHHINQAIKAHGIMKRDIDYVVRDGEVIIVDEFTGRLMIGRRYSEGLHQAIEAKEGVTVARESKTLATITFQNYFRLYKKLAGMTGTALTEEAEFQEIYSLDVVEVPTNKPLLRKDLPDQIYKNESAKFAAVIRAIEEAHAKGQPVLVGTISIEKSELLSSLLNKRGVKHEVLNAKHHDKEAQIVAQAGKPGAVTIATNMAGRGTDITLGGNAEYLAKSEMSKKGYSDEMIADASGFFDTDNEEIIKARAEYTKLLQKYKEEISSAHKQVVESGGLFIIGTERHESRRIDNQLRGRAGRQGDPGQTRFFMSLDDDLMRLFGSDKIRSVINALNFPENEPIEHPMLTNAIENAQKNVEGRNFSIRKHVLQFDEVMNEQRTIIYAERKKVLSGENLKPYIEKMIADVISEGAKRFSNGSDVPDDWDLEGMKNYFNSFIYEGKLEFTRESIEKLTLDSFIQDATEKAMEKYAAQESVFGEDLREIERVIMLRTIDSYWMDHIDLMDELKRGISLRAYGQRDPVIEFKFEGMDMFEEMTANIKADTVKMVLNVRPGTSTQRQEVAKPLTASHGDETIEKKPARVENKVGPNDPCPCGSGKKYKKCCRP
ncbi:MAG: preprotein translocase subunit SecA [Monoglobales bacterium]